jgi:hypothetical protein
MTDALVCWKCGTSLATQSLPLGRLAECDACRAPLHVCRLCRFYNPRVSNACEETIAEPVADKERANFCGYFEPRAGAYHPQGDAEAKAKARTGLDALFGDGTADRNDTGEDAEAQNRRLLDDLFEK